MTTTTRNRGVSSVIGVILLVAVTVIIAAVAGLYIFGFQTDTAVQPQAAWDDSETFDNDGDLETLTLSHNGGDEIDFSNVDILIGGAEIDPANPGSTTGLTSGTNVPDTATYTAGDSMTFEFDSADPFDAGTKIWFVWTDPDPDSDETRIIFEYELGSDTTS